MTRFFLPLIKSSKRGYFCVCVCVCVCVRLCAFVCVVSNKTIFLEVEEDLRSDEFSRQDKNVHLVHQGCIIKLHLVIGLC